MKKPVAKISIVMPVRNEGNRILKSIVSFVSGRSFFFPLEFIVVDDASTDGCCDGLSDLLNWNDDAAIVKVIRLNQWTGIPGARNAGAKEATADVLFITDANVEAVSGWDIPVFRDLRNGRALCATIADLSSAWRGYGCMLHPASMGISWLFNADAFNGYVPVAPCTGTILHTSLFHRLGGYDTAMPLYGAAEPEFSVRLWLYGAEIVVCPDLVLKHRFRPEEERKPFLKKIEFIQTMNYLRFGLLYLDEKDIPALFDYWSITSPQYFDRALEAVKAGGVWQRRKHLQESLCRNFNWYLKNFGLANQPKQQTKAHRNKNYIL